MVCENPTCKPKVDCCSCQPGAVGSLPKFPMFKEAEINPTCCPCANKWLIYIKYTLNYYYIIQYLYLILINKYTIKWQLLLNNSKFVFNSKQ